MNVTEACAVQVVLRRLCGPPVDSPEDDRPSDDELVAALTTLRDRAATTLSCGWRYNVEAAVSLLVACDSDAAAQATCDALAAHVAHGGVVPWPRLRRAYEAWVEARARVEERS